MPWWSDDISTSSTVPLTPDQVAYAQRVAAHDAAQRESRATRTADALRVAGEDPAAWHRAFLSPTVSTESGLWYQCADAGAAAVLQSRLSAAGLETVIRRHGDAAQGGLAGRIVHVAARDVPFHDAIEFQQRWQAAEDVYRKHVSDLATGDVDAFHAATQARYALYQLADSRSLPAAVRQQRFDAVEGRGPDALPQIGDAMAAGHASRRKRS